MGVSTVCRHLALVAVDGASDEVALTLSPDFLLHLDGLTTDRWGYLALIEANQSVWAGRRPPLDVVSAVAGGAFVSVCLEPRCLAHFRVVDGTLTELWITSDWHVWCRWLHQYEMT